MRAYERQKVKDVFIKSIIQNVLSRVTELNSLLKSLRFSASNDCNETVFLSNTSKEHSFLSAKDFRNAFAMTNTECLIIIRARI